MLRLLFILIIDKVSKLIVPPKYANKIREDQTTATLKTAFINNTDFNNTLIANSISI